MAYTYDPIFAKDPGNPNIVAANASITIYDPADPNKTPIALKDTTGSPLPNPITVNAMGMGSAFVHPTLDRVAWFGASFNGFFTAYEGMKDEAVAAKEAAQDAANSAATAAADRVTAAAVNPSGKLILTKGNGGTVDAGSVVGPPGVPGPPGQNGANVLPTDDAIEQAVKTKGSKTEAALSATYAGAFPAAQTIVYNTDGSVQSVTENGITTSYTYNSDGTVATDSRTVNGVITTRNYGYTNGNLTSITKAA
ncbi:YD repeat-containing protein [Arthrobacter sp. SLBN-83]|uniref:hypothetical protein n=1 Tax=Arthrobacter sp. SLBN-83 TaxID=2768449 RepID=UPI001154C0B4|nr:hypothetical protein [Arthrobacter sp. SLBN-83]TQJ60470.1 YD repeat-containing protein [Arthrobacter sp. SLBN-83]